MTNSTDALLDNINAAAKQIALLLQFGPVDMDRALYCTAGRFTEHELKSALKMLHIAGLADYRAGKYVQAAQADSMAA